MPEVLELGVEAGARERVERLVAPVVGHDLEGREHHGFIGGLGGGLLGDR